MESKLYLGNKPHRNVSVYFGRFNCCTDEGFFTFTKYLEESAISWMSILTFRNDKRVQNHYEGYCIIAQHSESGTFGNQDVSFIFLCFFHFLNLILDHAASAVTSSVIYNDCVVLAMTVLRRIRQGKENHVMIHRISWCNDTRVSEANSCVYTKEGH